MSIIRHVLGAREVRVSLYEEPRLYRTMRLGSNKTANSSLFRSPGYVKVILGKEECATLPVSGARLTSDRFDSYPFSIDLESVFAVCCDALSDLYIFARL